MKKHLILLIVCIFLIGCTATSVDNGLDIEIVLFSNEILSYSFESIRADKESSKVQSIDLIGPDDNTIIAHLPLPETLLNTFYDIRFENGDLIYVQTAAIDDETGIIFSKDAFINMNGFWSVERIGSSTYFFTTFRER